MGTNARGRRTRKSTAKRTTSTVLNLEGNAPVEVFPFVSMGHQEVVIRHLDGESQDIELTPDEAEHFAAVVIEAARRARLYEA